MRVLVGVLVLGLCAWQTHARIADWRSEQAIWTAATVTSPTLSRPWLNLAVTYLRTSQEDAAWRVLTIAILQAQAPGAPRDVLRPYLRSALLWADAVTFRCEQPAWRPLCALVA